MFKKIKVVLKSLGSFRGEQRNGFEIRVWRLPPWMWGSSGEEGPTVAFCWGLTLTSHHSLSLLPDGHPASRREELGWSQPQMGIWKIWQLDSTLPFPWPTFSRLSIGIPNLRGTSASLPSCSSILQMKRLSSTHYSPIISPPPTVLLVAPSSAVLPSNKANHLPPESLRSYLLLEAILWAPPALTAQDSH